MSNVSAPGFSPASIIPAFRIAPAIQPSPRIIPTDTTSASQSVASNTLDVRA